VSPDGQTVCEEAFPMGAGNAFSSAFVKVDSIYYLYHNDESVHGAVHRWRISGLNTLAEQSVLLNLKRFTSNGIRLRIFEGSDLDIVKLKAETITNTITNKKHANEIDDTANYSIQFKGLISPDSSGLYQFKIETQSGIKLWINNDLIIDKWQNNALNKLESTKIQLDQNTYYQIKLEATSGIFELKWGINGDYNAIKSQHLVSDTIENKNAWMDLLTNLIPFESLENEKYGWKRFPKENTSNSQSNKWQVGTNVKKFSSMDLNIVFKDTVKNVFIERNIGNQNLCGSDWEMRAELNFQNNTPNIDGNGFWIDILDKDNRIICRLNQEILPIPEKNYNYVKYIINGEDIISKPFRDLYQLLNYPFEITLKVLNKICYIQLANEALVYTKIFDTNAIWDKPQKIKITFKGSLENYNRELSISKLQFKTNLRPILVSSKYDSICMNQYVTLTSHSSKYYRWSNGDSAQTIRVKQNGVYTVKTSSDNKCFLESGKFILSQFLLPRPVISRFADTLKSNYTFGNQWYLNDEELPLQNQANLTIQKSGIYQLKIRDQNQCEAYSSKLDLFNSQIQVDNKIEPASIVIIPNPNKGCFSFLHLPEGIYKLELYDVSGRLIHEENYKNEQIFIEGLKSGIYHLIIYSDKIIFNQRLVIQN
jgi:hypothetical protein